MEETIYLFLEPHVKSLTKDYVLQTHHYKILDDKDFKGKILDVGCGVGEFPIIAKLKRPDIEIIAMDGNRTYSELGAAISVKSESEVVFYNNIIENEPFDEDTFDCIVLSHVIEHVPDLDRLFKWVNKIVKVGGVVYIATPYECFHDSPDHVHHFSLEKNKKIKSIFNGEIELEYLPDLLQKFNYNGNVEVFDEASDARGKYKTKGKYDLFIKLIINEHNKVKQE